MRNLYLIFFLLVSFSGKAQQKKRVLFLGNSYTAVNDLPGMLAAMATSMGDSLLYGRNTPGGYTLEDHFSNALTQNKIREGNWDYVVLQEQSQRPSLWDAEVNAFVYPFARKLDSMFVVHNPCGQTLFFMTWGRRSGDASYCASWPPVCTYSGMDSMLNLRYRKMAIDNHAEISPVGAVWHEIRNQYPHINLYNGDGSHPSLAGTYAAACSFYAAVFRKDPTTIVYKAGLDSLLASSIQLAAKTVVYDHFDEWHIGNYDPQAEFNTAPSLNNQVRFYNNSKNAAEYFWEFGDGQTDTIADPVHVYQQQGIYQVSLTVSDCDKSDIFTAAVSTYDSLTHTNPAAGSMLFPNPAQEAVYVKLTQADEVYLLNTLGQKIQVDFDWVPPMLRINLHTVANGTYIVVIRQQSKKLYRKLVKR